MEDEHFCLCPQHYNDFGDIIKETIYRSRQVDKMESAAALVLCLQQVKLISKGNTPADLWRAWPQHRLLLLSCSPGLSRSRRAERESVMESRPSPASESSPGDWPLPLVISSSFVRAWSWSTGQCCAGVLLFVFEGLSVVCVWSTGTV